MPNVILSIDTYKAETARVCLAEGAHIINDIWAFRYDPAMAGTVAEAGATAILMHNRTQGAQAVTSELGGRYEGVRYDDIVTEVRNWLAEAAESAIDAGVSPDRIIIDPGSVLVRPLSKTYSCLSILTSCANLASRSCWAFLAKVYWAHAQFAARRTPGGQPGCQRLGCAAWRRHSAGARREGDRTSGTHAGCDPLQRTAIRSNRAKVETESFVSYVFSPAVLEHFARDSVLITMGVILHLNPEEP